MKTSANKVRKGRKFDQVLEGARQVFLTHGFEGASVDDIAREAGVSKATLYSYFPDKRLLFMEVATTQCAVQAEQAIQSIDFSQPVQNVLRQVADQMLGFILSDMGQRIFRVCVAEADRFPDLGQKFYQSGPDHIRTVLVTFLKNAVARGELQIDDHNLAADQFVELCKADLWAKLVFGLRSTFTDEERDRVITGAIDTFMARYGTKT
ncbi:TetR/AcrR family transcriptional regulator [Pseudoprimorskyibacter insulae]|uniref:HTH-type transcriptional repressor AcnR n=1 Tax=Pseudoprimorskyibacter insulae TaxID=1695997 RepID=A0A2R8AYK5_9RHOB|nr:TetR/AcrR family transcriptional regulator [Pseudoprimorskyibacter insulae]SPF81111.1 HTH-type transcriptional repressor AcnR [Pseudoprimorskyibacter insulae]